MSNNKIFKLFEGSWFMAVKSPRDSPRRRRFYALLTILALAAFLALQFYPLGLQAVLLGRMVDVSASPTELMLYASNASLFCYSGVLEVRNLGEAGLTYSLNFSLDGRATLFEVRSSNATLLALPAGISGKLDLAPGSSARLTLCVRGPADPSLRLVAEDPRYPEATRLSVAINVRGTDWWNNTFPRRIEIAPVVAREGLALFEVTGEGEVYVNGRYVRRIPGLAGVPAGSVLVVYRAGGADYLLPSQVEAWVLRSDGVLEPRGNRNPREPIASSDRLVFAAYLANGSRIFIYTGGGSLIQPWPSVEVRDSLVSAGSFTVKLDSYGFLGPGFSANLSGSIAYPYTVRREDYSDPGVWRLVAAGPVRAVLAFNTSGVSQYGVEAFLTVWGRGVDSALAYVWPRVEYRGIILEWIGAIVSATNATITFECGTTCNTLPVKLERVSESTLRVVLCRNYWQPGKARFGYYVLLFSKPELAELKTMGARLSNFPGG
uniref:Uncharacterized protein n=1 Tax=Thermofilum adornatum TaxID=1365176 RepID=A0A7C1GQ15_9CREN